MSYGRPLRSRPRPWSGPLLLLLRLAVMGVGLGLIAGTGLKLLAPRLAPGSVLMPPLQAPPPPATGLSSGRFQPRQQLGRLSRRWQQLAAAQPELTASAFLLVLDDGRYAEMRSELPLPAASAIKTPILLAALEDLDAGKLRWNESLTLTRQLVGGGAGWMASRPLGSRFPVHEAATEMIRVSDNSATNLLIQRLGGRQAVNQRFRALGLSATTLRNWLPDLDGTNTTSSRDLARAIALVDTGAKLSPRARDLFRQTLARSATNTLIPLGMLMALGREAPDPDSELLAYGISVLNKTGDIGIAYADAALIELPDGQRAVAAFLVKGPFNDPRSAELIRAMAGEAAKTLLNRS